MSKHKIDTLIISGGGPSGIAYNGIFKALVEKLSLDFLQKFENRILKK